MEVLGRVVHDHGRISLLHLEQADGSGGELRILVGLELVRTRHAPSQVEVDLASDELREHRVAVEGAKLVVGRGTDRNGAGLDRVRETETFSVVPRRANVQGADLEARAVARAVDLLDPFRPWLVHRLVRAVAEQVSLE